MNMSPRKLRSSDALARIIGITLATVPGFAAGCAQPQEDSTSARELEQLTHVPWVVDSDPPSFCKPDVPVALPPGGSTADRARAFLAQAGPAIRMRSAETEYALAEENVSADGRKHVRLQQMQSGVEVENGYWTLHLDGDENLTVMSGTYVPRVEAAGAPVPQTPPEDAARAALDAYSRANPNVERDGMRATTPRVVYIATATGARLAYAVSVHGRSPSVAGTSYRVDALTGQILTSWPNASNIDKSFDAQGYGSKHYLPFSKFRNNASLGMVTFPVSAARAPAEMSGNLKLGEATVAISTEALSYATKEPMSYTINSSSIAQLTPWKDAIRPEGVAIDAQSNAATVAQFYATLQRDGKPYLSHDGKGSPLVSIVNVSANDVPTGAMWSFDPPAMFYSDTNPSGNANDGYYPIAASLESVAHEVTHGVSHATWRKTPNSDLETGAIDESMSDVFASFVAHRLAPDDQTDFLFSEDDNALGHPWRSLAYPKQRGLIDPQSDSGANGHCDFAKEVAEGKCRAEVHRMAGIPNHAFYLMTHGGLSAHTFQNSGDGQSYRISVPCGIGWDAALKLYWELESHRMDGAEKFRRMAFDSVAAAKDLAIPTESVACAWVAVGVLEAEDAKQLAGATCEQVSASEGGGPPSDLASTQSGGVTLLQTGGPIRLLCPGAALIPAR